MEKDFVEMTEVWMPVKEGGEAWRVGKGPLKLVARLLDGYPIFLEEDFCVEKRYLTKEEAAQKEKENIS